MSKKQKSERQLTLFNCIKRLEDVILYFNWYNPDDILEQLKSVMSQLDRIKKTLDNL